VTDLLLLKAKTERLMVSEIDGETLVYDRRRDAASCLNEFAARVWRECNDETPVMQSRPRWGRTNAPFGSPCIN
jgi:hypothetical protein